MYGKMAKFETKIFREILTAFLLIIFLCSSGYGNDDINLGLIEEFGYTGAIGFVEIYRDSVHDKVYAYCGTQEGLLIIDITDPDIPRKCGFLEMGKINALAFYQPNDSQNFSLLLTAEGGMTILDLEDPAEPFYVGKYEFLEKADNETMEAGTYVRSGTGPGNMAISGHYAYIVDSSEGLVIIDINDPSRPAYAGGYHTEGKAKDIAITGKYACIADGSNGLVIINISDPTKPFYAGGNPVDIGSWDDEYRKDALAITVDGGCAYLTFWEKGLVIVDISDPSEPSVLNWYDTQGDALDIAVSKNYAYVANGQEGLLIVDVSDPNEPMAMEKRYDNPQQGAKDIVSSDNYMCITHCQGKGVTILTIADPAMPAVEAGNYIGEGYGRSMTIVNDYAYLAEEKAGLTVINIKDPTEPIVTGKCHTGGMASDIDIFGDYAYMAENDNGLVIIDISDPNNPVKKGQCSTSWCARGIKVFGNYAFIADTVKGLMIFDISDPNSPFDTGKPDMYMNAVDIDIASNGSYAYVTVQGNGLYIFDISNPNNPVHKSTYPYQGDMGKDIVIRNNFAYMTTGAEGLQIIDITNPDAPTLAGCYEDESGVYGVTVSGNYAYAANDEKGLTVIDIHNPTAPVLSEKYGTQGLASGVAVSEKYAFVADAENGLSIFEIIDTASPQGNLILCPSGPASIDNALWSPSQALSNLVYATFLDQNYPHHSIYYVNPNPYQDIDNDGSPDPLVVDSFNSSLDELHYALTQWAGSRLNTGPLYLYLSGLGDRDVYQIFPGEILKAEDPDNPSLKEYLDIFQEETGRDCICIMEFSSSGSFCDNLIDPGTGPYSRSIITCTDAGSAYLNSDGSLSFMGRLFTLLRNTPMSGLFSDTGISHYHRVKLLQSVFSRTRKNLWLSNKPFNTQPPQMVTAGGPHTLCNIKLSVDYANSSFTYTDTNQIVITDPNHSILLKATGHYLDGDISLDGRVFYQSSDPKVLCVTREGKVFANPDTNYRGGAYILATIIDPNFTQTPDHDFSEIPSLGGVTGRIFIKSAIAKRIEKEDLPKAIIVAGRSNDPAGYDYLWESTGRMANHAYNTFIERDYSPENIFYLSHSPNQLGVDGPDPASDRSFFSILNELFTNPNNPYLNLRELTDLTIFLIDHGQNNRFILGPEDNQFLTPDTLDRWLDILQKNCPLAKITIIIEACFAGSFVEPLMCDAENRIVITSTQDSLAFLAANGWVSFTYFLFNYLQSGAHYAVAFEKAYKNIASLSWGGIQRPVLKDTSLGQLARETCLGGPFLLSQSQPQILQVSTFDDPNNPIVPDQPIHLWARIANLKDVDRVWAVISNAQSSLHFSTIEQEPINMVNLPRVELVYNPATDLYEGLYEGFAYAGSYTVIIMAEDVGGIVSSPKTIYLTVEGYRKNIAILVHDAGTASYTNFAQRVLEKRRFPESDIYNLQGIEALPDALNTYIGPDDRLDQLILYFISQDTLDISEVEIVNTQLDLIQQDTNCTLIAILDTDESGCLLPVLKGPKRIIISSTGENQQITLGYSTPPFSQFFFSGIYNGVNINQAFHMACLATGYYSLQNPFLDDNGNGIGSEYGSDFDGQLASRVYLGSPFEAVAASPGITVPSVVHINGWETSTATVWAETQDPEDRVSAHIICPEGITHTILLEYNPDEDRFEADYQGFIKEGTYKVMVITQNQTDLLDYDVSPYIVLKPDRYEADDVQNFSNPIMVNQAPQKHSFHTPGDHDLLHFYGYAALPYEVKAEKLWPDCQLRIDVYAPDGTLINHSPYAVGFSAPENGFYTIAVSYTCPALPDEYPTYQLSVICPSAATGGIWGWVRDADTGAGLVGAQICTPFEQCVGSLDGWWSDDPNASIHHIERGFYFMDALPVVSGGLPVSVHTEGYLPTSTVITDYHQNLLNITFYLENDPNTTYTPSFDPDELFRTILLLRQKSYEIMVKIHLHKGLNLFAHPNVNPNYYYDVWDFLLTHEPDFNLITGPSWFSGIRCYDSSDNSQEICYFIPPEQDLWSLGPDHFPIASDMSYAVYMMQAKTIEFPIPIPNPGLDLKKGINYIGIPSPPPNFTSYLMLQDIGTSEEVVSISGFNPLTGRRGNTYWNYTRPSGDNFPIQAGFGYTVYMKKELFNWFPGSHL